MALDVPQPAGSYSYTIEKNGFGFVLVEKRTGTPPNVERRMPYSLQSEYKSVQLLQAMHEGTITQTLEQNRVEQAQSINSYITERFIDQAPTLLNVETLREEIEKLIGCIVAEMRPNTGTPGRDTEAGIIMLPNQEEGRNG